MRHIKRGREQSRQIRVHNDAYTSGVKPFDILKKHRAVPCKYSRAAGFTTTSPADSKGGDAELALALYLVDQLVGEDGVSNYMLETIYF